MATTRGKERLREGLLSLEQFRSVYDDINVTMESLIRVDVTRKHERITNDYSRLIGQLEEVKNHFLRRLSEEADDRKRSLAVLRQETEEVRQEIEKVSNEASQLLTVTDNEAFFSRYRSTNNRLQLLIDSLIVGEANWQESSSAIATWLCESAWKDATENLSHHIAMMIRAPTQEKRDIATETTKAVNLSVGLSGQSTPLPSLADCTDSCSSSISAVDEFDAIVTAVEAGPSSFWIQRSCNKLDRLSASLQKIPSLPPVLSKGEMCAATRSLNGTWHRAIVQDVIEVPTASSVEQSPLMIDVFFLDIGVRELLTLAQVRRLKPKYQSIPPFAQRCCLASSPPWNDAGDLFSRAFLNENVSCQMLAARQPSEPTLVNLQLKSGNELKGWRDVLGEMAVSLLQRHSSRLQSFPRSPLLKEIVLDVGERKVPLIVASPGSPDEFHVHLLDDDDTHLFDDLLAGMTEHYERAATKDRVLIDVQIGSAYAVWSALEKQWCRGIVLDKSDDDVRMRLVDCGLVEVVPRESVYPLDVEFAKLGQQAILCSLADVRPAGRESSLPSWSDEAIELFRKWTSECEVLYGSVVKSDCLAGNERRLSLHVYVQTEGDDETICLNQLLVDAGVATSTCVFVVDDDETKEISSPSASSAISDNSNETLSTWNPIENDAVSQQNFYGVSSDLGVALHGCASLPTQKPICRYYLRGGCARGSSCRYVHSMADRFVTGTHFNCRSLGLPPVKSYVSIVVTAFTSPEYFYGQVLLILKTPEDSILENAGEACWLSSNAKDFLGLLKEHRVNGSPYLNADVGGAVAARSKVDNKWYRGLILSRRGPVLKVFYVDYGNTELLEEERISALNTVFNHCPMLAVRFKLHGVTPSKGRDWSIASTKYFLEHTKDKGLVAFIHSRNNEDNVLTVDLYDTNEDRDVSVKEMLIKKGFASGSP